MQGTFDMLILRTLHRRLQHGDGIGMAIGAESHHALEVDHDRCTPRSIRLEKQDWIEAESKITENRQRGNLTRRPPPANAS
jgi:hypothetical protein